MVRRSLHESSHGEEGRKEGPPQTSRGPELEVVQGDLGLRAGLVEREPAPGLASSAAGQGGGRARGDHLHIGQTLCSWLGLG